MEQAISEPSLCAAISPRGSPMNHCKALTDRQTETAIVPEPRPRRVLVLQGGGALGAYQAGVYDALSEVGAEPDWLAGISIGAVNAAIIAGNPP